MRNLNFEDLLGIEKSFVKPVLSDIQKSLKMIFEGKQIRLVGSDFNKNIIFYINQDLKSAKFDLSEGKIKIYSIEDIKIDAESFKQQFENLMSEAIDDLAAEKINEAQTKFGKAVEIVRSELSGGKIDIFTKRPPLLRESKVAIKKIIKHDNKADIRILVEKAKELKENYYGKDIIAEEYYEISEGKAKHIENKQKEPSMLCKVITAKKESRNLNVTLMLENVEKFISEHEEVFFITSDKLKAKLDEAAKKDVSATKEKINEVVVTFKKMRNKSPEFRKIVNTIMNEQNEPAELDGQNGEQVPVTKAGLEQDLDDKVVSDLDRKTEEDKLGFMTQFVDILEKLFQKIKEVGADDEDVTRRADFALDTIAKAKEEGKWDKDELSEIAREAVEVAAKLEGIEPEETAVSKAAEEAGEEEVKDQETIDQPEPEAASVEVGEPGTESSEEEVEDDALKAIEKGEEEEEEEDELDEDVTISPEGEVSYEDVEADSNTEAEADEELDEIKCFACDEKFAVKKGRGSYKCPYCAQEVNCDMEEKVAEELISPKAEEAEDELEETGVPINNIHPQELDEAKKDKPFTVKENPKSSRNKDIPFTSKVSPQPMHKIEEADEADKEVPVEIDAAPEEVAAETPDEETIEVSDTGVEKEIPIDTIKSIIVKTEEPADESQEAYKAKWEEMQGEEDLDETSPAADQPGQEVAGNYNYPIAENEMKTTPQPGKIENADGQDTPLKDSGPAMSKNPAKGKAEPADGTKLPDSGEKMSSKPAKGKMKRMDGKPISTKGGKDSTWPKVGKIEAVDGTELPDSGGTPMKTDATKGTIKNADGSTGLPDSGPAMKTDATVGKIETLKESEDIMSTEPQPGKIESAGGERLEGIEEEMEEQIAQPTEVPIQEKEISSAPAKNADVLATYRSASNPDRRYYIVRGKDGVVYCTCLTGDTKVPLLDGRILTMEELNKEYGTDKEFWLYASDENGDFVPAKAKCLGITGDTNKLYEIILDNDKSVKCTSDHLFRMRDGSYKQAKDLRIDDSLMPLYLNIKKSASAYSQPYLKVKVNSKVDSMGRPIYKMVHRVVAETVLKDEMNNKINECREKKSYEVVHHKDMKTFNNTPENLQWLEKEEHWFEHALYHPNATEAYKRKWKEDKEFIEKQTEVNRQNGKDFQERAKENPELLESFIAAGKKWSQSDESKNGARERMIVMNKLPRVPGKAGNAKIDYNHKIKDIKILQTVDYPVYDLTVEKYHNFALDAGIFVHNCPAWKFSGKGGEQRTCKHLQDFKGQGSGVVKEMIEGVEEAFVREDAEADVEEEGYPAIHQPAIAGQREEEETEDNVEEQSETFPSTQTDLMAPAAGTKLPGAEETEEDEEMDEKYMGFKKLVKSLKAKGVKEEDSEEELDEAYNIYIKEGAEALAAWIGRRKLGKKEFQRRAAAGRKKKE